MAATARPPCSSCAATPKRGLVLEALRDSGAQGLLRSELVERFGGGSAIHIESLRHDGAGIAEQPDRNAVGFSDTRYRLTTDPSKSSGDASAPLPASQSPGGGARDSQLAGGSPGQRSASDPSNGGGTSP
jgi:hypothetical protein